MTVSDVRQAFFEGDFERALLLCDVVLTNDEETCFEIAMLRARALIRLDQGDRAVEVLSAHESWSLHVDRMVTLRMLLGAAYVRLGQIERGALILHDTMDASAGSHPTIRAELALHLGIAWFRLGDYDEASRLLGEVPDDADIIHARALEYSGWVAQACGDFAGAARGFHSALVALRTSAYADRYVEANVLYGLAMLAPDLLLLSDWATLEPWLRRFDWSISGVAHLRFWTLIASATMAETLGDIAAARLAARAAEELALNDAQRVVARCQMAITFRGIGEMQAHAEFLGRARAVYDRLNVRDLPADVQLLPLDIAEECVHGGLVDDAAAFLVRYREVIAPASRSGSHEAERSRATADSVEALIRQARGDYDGAVRLFTSAYRTFAGQGFRRRATGLALILARLTGKKRYERYAAEALVEVHPSHWMARELADLRGAAAPALTRTESEILGMVVRGHTYKEIAAKRGVAWKTVGNHVQSLFRKFGVRSRGELAAEALRLRVASVETRRTVSA